MRQHTSVHVSSVLVSSSKTCCVYPSGWILLPKVSLGSVTCLIHPPLIYLSVHCAPRLRVEARPTWQAPLSCGFATESSLPKFCFFSCPHAFFLFSRLPRLFHFRRWTSKCRRLGFVWGCKASSSTSGESLPCWIILCTGRYEPKKEKQREGMNHHTRDGCMVDAREL